MDKAMGVLIIIIGIFLLFGCGGGGGGGSSLPGSPSTPRPHPINFGYFGYADGNAVEQADHVDYIFAMDWGSWDSIQQPGKQLQIISWLQDAKARGIQKAVIGVGFLTWDNQGNLKGTQYLQVFKTQLEALGLDDMILALYPIDEPDLAIKEGRMTLGNLHQGIMNIHSVFPEARLMVIYGDNGYPLIEVFDIVGKDKYREGPQVPPINANQTMAIVAGGADPYRDDPEQFYEFAKRDLRVEFVVAFLYVDYTALDGKPAKGIRNNGMLPAYKAVAHKLKELQ